MERIIKSKDVEDVTSILSHFETRSNKDTLLLMRVAFESGRDNHSMTFDEWFSRVKRELLDL